MFYISVSNGLLTQEHRKRMGSAVWEFMWCIDKITKIDAKGVGYVLGGAPIKLSRVAEQLGSDEETISRNLIKLEKFGYIEKTRTPYGMVIKVLKAKKRFNKSVESHPENVESRRKNVESNKTVSVDNTVDNIAPEKTNVFSPQEFFEESEVKGERYKQLIVSLVDEKEYLSTREVHRIVIEEFIPHWREGRESGKKELWQRERVFDVKKRLVTWIRNYHTFRKDWQCRGGRWHQKGNRCECTRRQDEAEERRRHEEIVIERARNPENVSFIDTEVGKLAAQMTRHTQP